MIFDGLDLLAVIIIVLALYFAFHRAFRYAGWRRFDRTLRHERMVHRNLQRIGGWQS